MHKIKSAKMPEMRETRETREMREMREMVSRLHPLVRSYWQETAAGERKSFFFEGVTTCRFPAGQWMVPHPSTNGCHISGSVSYPKGKKKDRNLKRGVLEECGTSWRV